jgi:hypothetical protein
MRSNTVVWFKKLFDLAYVYIVHIITIACGDKDCSSL